MSQTAQILDIALQKDASDIHITSGRPITYRIHGTLVHENPAPSPNSRA